METSDERRAAASDGQGPVMMPWRTFVARAGVASGLFGLAMFAAIRLASAVPGGPTTPMLMYAGVLHGVSTARMATLTFTFTKPGAAPCPVEVRDVPIAAGGAFTAGVSIASCPNYFDGSNVTYTVAEGRDMLTPDSGVAITPVPYARFADQVGVNNDCPVGYERDPASPGGRTFCRKALAGGLYDEVVRVGGGASAFWIDRCEASVWSTQNAMPGSRLGETNAEYGMPPSSQYDRAPSAYALSVAGVIPSRYTTWFQANEICMASGKRLPRGEEWLLAARGTPDPPTAALGADVEGRCLTNVRTVGRTCVRAPTTGTIGCQSYWGAQDMIGNLPEWTAEWYAGSGRNTPPDGGAPLNWGVDFGDDFTSAITSTAFGFGGGLVTDRYIPAGVARGGGWGSSVGAGVFAMSLNNAPSNFTEQSGFRCVIPR